MNPSNRLRAACFALAVWATVVVLGGIAFIADQRPVAAPMIAAAQCDAAGQKL